MRKSNYFIKKCQLLLFILSLFFISACSFKEIEKNAFIAALGIDPTDNPEKPYKVTLKIYNPSNSTKEVTNPDYTYISEEGQSISDALRLLETKVDKRLEFGHLRFIIIGEESLKELNIEEMTDFLLRRPDIQLISWLMIGRPSAEEIIRMVPKTETAAYPALYNYFDQNANESPYVVSTFLFDFERRRVERGIDPVLPIIENEEKQYKIFKSMVIGENKEVELDHLETKLYNLVKGELVRADILVDLEGELFMVEATDFNTNYRTIENSDGSITLKLDLNIQGVIVESKKTLSMENLDKYNRLVEEDSKKAITKILTKFIEAEIDPLGYGIQYKASRLHNQLIKYEEWKKLYQDANVDITIKADLKTTGSG